MVSPAAPNPFPAAPSDRPVMAILVREADPTTQRVCEIARTCSDGQVASNQIGQIIQACSDRFLRANLCLRVAVIFQERLFLLQANDFRQRSQSCRLHAVTWSAS